MRPQNIFASLISKTDPTALLCFEQVVLHNWHAEFQKWLPQMPIGAPGLSLRKVSSVGI